VREGPKRKRDRTQNTPTISFYKEIEQDTPTLPWRVKKKKR
jgi:hypothetical protein